MNRIKSFLILLAMSLSLLMPASLAQVSAAPFTDVCSANPNASQSTVCQSQNDSSNPIFGTNGVLVKAIRLVSVVVAIASVFMIVISGIRFVIANGDSAAINQAKNTLYYAIIGLVVAGLAQGIVVFVVNRVG